MAITDRSWWVYEDWGIGRVRLHHADCPYCKKYRDRPGGARSKWHGPFLHDVAVGLAQDLLKHPDKKRCSYCKKHRLGHGQGAWFFEEFIDRTKSAIGLGAKANDAIGVFEFVKEMLE